MSVKNHILQAGKTLILGRWKEVEGELWRLDPRVDLPPEGDHTLSRAAPSIFSLREAYENQ